MTIRRIGGALRHWVRLTLAAFGHDYPIRARLVTLRGILLAFALLDLLLFSWIILNSTQMRAIAEELPKVYGNSHLRTAQVGDLSLRLYSPERLVSGMTSDATLVAVNRGTEVLRDVRITIGSGTGDIQFVMADGEASNSILFASLMPGVEHSQELSIISARTSDRQQGAITADLYVSYWSGGLHEQTPRITEDVTLLEIEDPTAEPEHAPGMRTVHLMNNGKSALKVTTTYSANPAANPERSGWSHITVLIECEAAEAEIQNLTLTIVHPSDSSVNEIDCGGSNAIQVGELQHGRVWQTACDIAPASIPGGDAAALQIKAHVDYRVAERRANVSKTLKDQFVYQVSTLNRIHAPILLALKLMRGLTDFLSGISTAAQALIAAVVALVAALIIPFKPVRNFWRRAWRWVRGAAAAPQDREQP